MWGYESLKGEGLEIYRTIPNLFYIKIIRKRIFRVQLTDNNEINSCVNFRVRLEGFAQLKQPLSEIPMGCHWI